MEKGIKLNFDDSGDSAIVLVQTAEELSICELGGPCRFARTNAEEGGHRKQWCDKSGSSIWDNYNAGGCPRKRWDRCKYLKL